MTKTTIESVKLTHAIDKNRHTPEPWTYGEDNDGWYLEKSGSQLAYQVVDEADARRIVACVNALQGVPTEQLEQAAKLGITDVSTGNLFSYRIALQKQRDELLSAFQKFVDSHEECLDFDGFTAQTVTQDDYHEACEAIDAARKEVK